MEKLISVIVPVYGVEKYIEHCVNSILHQTYHNLEIILVDDGSPDNCGCICDDFARRDNRIKVIHKKNGGLSDARNEGLKIANGDFLAFVDSDDWIDLTLFEKVINGFENHNVEIVCFGSYKTDGNKKITHYVTNKEFEWTKDEALNALCKNDRIESHVWDKVYKKELFESITFPVGKCYEDVYVMHRVFMRAKNILFIDSPLYYYIQRSSSIVGQRTVQSSLDLIKGFQCRQSDFRKSHNNDLAKTTEESVVWAALDVMRTIAIIGPANYESEIKKLKAILEKCTCKEFKIPYMTRAFKMEYFIIRNNSKIYFLYRSMVNFINREKISPIKQAKYVYRAIKKLLEYLRKKVNPISDALKSRRKERSIVLMGTPEYNNLGDLAIAYATREYIVNNFDKQFIEVTEREIDFKLNEVKKYIRDDDLLLLQGGGNLGDVYYDQQRIRKKVIMSFPNNSIILMPQTMYFSKTQDGKKSLRITAELFKEHKKLVLFAREQFSYNKMKNAFSNQTYIAPDIVLTLSNKEARQKRCGVGICLRNDKEGALNLTEKEYIIDEAKKVFAKVHAIDTITSENVCIKDRKLQLDKMWSEISRNQLIITDRLHGVIFSVITNTPCIALANNNKKVQGICKWLESYPGINYCDDPYEIKKCMEAMINVECHYTCDDSNYAMLTKQIGEIING